jgi:hypothetical protein
MDPVPERPDQVDATAPSAARVYDYFLGGKDNFAADRELAERIQAVLPGGWREAAAVNRRFILKAVQWCASMLDVGQFLDLGCGLPLKPSVHDCARAGHPEAAVVYVDNDPMVLSHVSALQSGPGLAAVRADVADPARVLELVTGLPGGLVDLSRPVAIVLGGTLSTMEAETAQAAMAGYAAGMAPGSAAIISCLSYSDEAAGAEAERMYSVAGPWHNHPAGDVASFFGGLRIIHDRVMDVRCWPACPLVTQDQPEALVLGGIGVTG